MKTATLRIFCLPMLLTLVAVLAVGAAPPQPAQAMEMRVRGAMTQLPLYFVENRGQVDDRVAYYVQGHDKSLYFTAAGLTFVLNGPQEQRYALRLDFVDADPAVRPAGRDRAEAVISYFRGPPDEWKTGLPTYAAVAYADLWPGIDLVYSGTVNRLKYEFIVQPGADPADIRLAYRGATVRVNDAGQLEVSTPAGGFHDARPYAYQEVAGRRAEVPVAYALETDAAGAHRYGFQVGSYDPDLPLVLDPEVFVYAGYIGGSSSDRGYDIAVDGSGAAYVTGDTYSTEITFPDGDGFGTLPGPDKTYNGAEDAFVAKVAADGSGLVYASYIGGTGDERPRGIAVDGSGAAYVTGWTDSSQDEGFPVLVGPDMTYNGGDYDYDAFVAKVNAAGTALVYCGYIGGPGADYGLGIAVDGGGAAYVTGDTYSNQSTFPDGDGFGALSGPDTSLNGSLDAFVAKVAADGSGLVYAGYIGGANVDSGQGIAVDGNGAAYVVGSTDSNQATFPDGDGFGALPGPDKTYNGGTTDAFVAKVAADGSGLVYASYIGGAGEDGSSGTASGIAVDAGGAAYLTGYTASSQTSFPDGDGFGTLPGPDKTFNGGAYDAFVAKIQADGSGLVYAGYIGGSSDDYGCANAVDGSGAAYAIGRTESTETTFPDGDGFGALPGPDTTHNGNWDGFVVKVRPDGSGLVYGSYIGGVNLDFSFGIAVVGSGAAYVTGWTGSSEATFPDGDGFGTLTGPDTTHNGANDAFVAKIETMSTILISEVLYDPPAGCTEPGAEWVELYNASSSAVTLTDWQLCDDSGCDTIPTTTIQPKQGLVVAGAQTDFLACYTCSSGHVIYVADGALGSGLDNDGDRVRLLDENGVEMDAVSYGADTYAFIPASPDVGEGHSLERYPIQQDTDAAADFRDQGSPSPCLSPTAVGLAAFAVEPSGWPPASVALAGGLAALLLGGAWVVARRRPRAGV